MPPISFVIPQGQVTLLHNVAQNGHIEVCVLLLDKGADVNAVNKVSGCVMEGCISAFVCVEGFDHVERGGGFGRL